LDSAPESVKETEPVNPEVVLARMLIRGVSVRSIALPLVSERMSASVSAFTRVKLVTDDGVETVETETVTESETVLVPFVQESVYVVLVVGVTEREPEVPVAERGDTEQLVAPELDQEMVADWPLVIETVESEPFALMSAVTVEGFVDGVVTAWNES
jgi:hypothetical protein